MPISERERTVKAPVRRCGRSALSIPGEGCALCSRVVFRALSGQECRIVCNMRNSGGTAVIYRPEAFGFGAFFRPGQGTYWTKESAENERTAKGV